MLMGMYPYSYTLSVGMGNVHIIVGSSLSRFCMTGKFEDLKMWNGQREGSTFFLLNIFVQEGTEGHKS